MISALRIVDMLEDTKREIRAQQNRYHRLDVNWEATQDIRSAWFDGTWKILTLAQAHWHLYIQGLARIEFWRSISRNFPPELMEVLKSEANSLYKFSVVHTTYSQMEEALRRITQAADPTFMETRKSVYAITQHLTDELKLKRHRKLFTLIRLLRNSIHNNGYHRPDPPRGNQQVTVKGITYKFRVNEAILFAEWPFIAAHIQDLGEAMADIVTDSRIVGLGPINRSD